MVVGWERWVEGGHGVGGGGRRRERRTCGDGNVVVVYVWVVEKFAVAIIVTAVLLVVEEVVMMILMVAMVAVKVIMMMAGTAQQDSHLDEPAKDFLLPLLSPSIRKMSEQVINVTQCEVVSNHRTRRGEESFRSVANGRTVRLPVQIRLHLGGVDWQSRVREVCR